MSVEKPWMKIGSGANGDDLSLVDDFVEYVRGNTHIVFDVLKNPSAASLEIGEDIEVALLRHDQAHYDAASLEERRQRVAASIAIFGIVHMIFERSDDSRRLDFSKSGWTRVVKLLDSARDKNDPEATEPVNKAYRKFNERGAATKGTDDYRVGNRIIGLIKLRAFADVIIQYDTEQLGTPDSQTPLIASQA